MIIEALHTNIKWLRSLRQTSVCQVRSVKPPKWTGLDYLFGRRRLLWYGNSVWPLLASAYYVFGTCRHSDITRDIRESFLEHRFTSRWNVMLKLEGRRSTPAFGRKNTERFLFNIGNSGSRKKGKNFKMKFETQCYSYRFTQYGFFLALNIRRLDSTPPKALAWEWEPYEFLFSRAIQSFHQLYFTLPQFLECSKLFWSIKCIILNLINGVIKSVASHAVHDRIPPKCPKQASGPRKWTHRSTDQQFLPTSSPIMIHLTIHAPPNASFYPSRIAISCDVFQRIVLAILVCI